MPIKSNSKKGKTIRLPQDKIYLSFTKREWNLIDARISKSGNKNGVISHIVREVKKIDEMFEEIDCEKPSLIKIEKRQFYPPCETYEKLVVLSKKMSIPASTIVSRYIISPLLRETDN